MGGSGEGDEWAGRHRAFIGDDRPTDSKGGESITSRDKAGSKWGGGDKEASARRSPSTSGAKAAPLVQSAGYTGDPDHLSIASSVALHNIYILFILYICTFSMRK